ncbi:MAG: hypothetical protein ABEI27_08210 [Halobellus sp.]|uniref:hypothetical protein n=1 Tax=Halobellus sp. TaxID=1979212 RepID=UPI0035D48A18
MHERTEELIEEFEVVPELIEGLLLQYAPDFDAIDPSSLDETEAQVYEFLEEDDQPIRSAADHFYQFELTDEHGVRSDAPATEPDFEMALENLVTEGLIARTDENPPRYSASFHDTLWELGPDFTPATTEQLCSTTGMDSRAVYRAILGSLDLNLEIGR